MKPIFNKLLVSAIVTSSLVATSFNTNAKNEIDAEHFEHVKRDIKLMSTILKTSLKDKMGRYSGRIKGRYLANQGLVFELGAVDGFVAPNVFHGDEDNEFITERTFTIAPVLPPMPPKPFKASGSEENSLEQEIEESVEIMMETENTEHIIEMTHHDLDEIEYEIHRATVFADSTGHLSPQLEREMREKKKVLRSKQREFSKKSNKLERQIRQLEREIRDAEMVSEMNDKDASKEVKALESEMQTLNKKLATINAEMKSYHQEVKKLADKAKQELAKKREKVAKDMESTIGEVVCDFSGGLKSLKKDKYLSFFINNSSQRYYVFNQNDIKKCNDGKIDYKTLINRAVQYRL